MLPDLINGLFEGLGALLIWLNVKTLIQTKQLIGFRLSVVAFFAAWGYWNLFYYPSLNQPISTAFALVLALGNTFYTVLALIYRRRDARHKTISSD